MDEITKTLEVLRRGGVILYPTDTVWGIGCDATNAEAVARVYAIKQRDDSKALVMLLDNADSVASWITAVPDVAYELWEVTDKPLTLVLPGAKGLADNLMASDGSVAIRVSSDDFCRRLIRSFGRPLVSTSANLSGGKTPKSYKDIAPEIVSAVDYVVDPQLERGATGKASSIIKLGLGGEFEIIRP